MSRHPSGPTGLGLSPASAPSEALLFARVITGNSRLGSTTEDARAQVDYEYLEWLAAISPEYERRPRNLAESPRADALRTEHLEWLADISPEYARQLRESRREDAIAEKACERSRGIENERAGYWEYLSKGWLHGGLDSDHPGDLVHTERLPDLGQKHITLYGVARVIPWKK